LKDPQFAKLVVFVNSLVPLALLFLDAKNDRLGPNPIEYAIRETGTLALIFLFLTLTITPVRKLTGWNWLSHFRREIGLFAFFYGLVHFSIYFGFYQSFNVKKVIADTIARRFILAGMGAMTILTPLALTSTNSIIKRMGAARWKKLHSYIYYAAGLGVLHYYLLVKADETKPEIYAAVLAVLLGYRLVVHLLRKKPAASMVIKTLNASNN